MLTLSLEFNKYTLPINKMFFVDTTCFCLYPNRLTLFILLGSLLLLLLLLLYLHYLYFWCTLLRHIVSVFITCLVLVSQGNKGELGVCIYMLDSKFLLVSQVSVDLSFDISCFITWTLDNCRALALTSLKPEAISECGNSRSFTMRTIYQCFSSVCAAYRFL